MADTNLSGLPAPGRNCGRTWMLLALGLVRVVGGRELEVSFFGHEPDTADNASASERVARAKRLLTKADAVCFDVDSTIVTTEGIDLFGKCFETATQIADLTQKAMNGHVHFQDALRDRLQLLADHGMTRETLKKCVETEGVPSWTPGIREVVKRFHAMGVDVYLVSGGFKDLVQPVARELDIPDSMVFANTILFDKQGDYVGFDKRALTSASGGKPEVFKLLQRKMGYKTMIMIGDGATDLEARTEGPAAAFVGYGGVVARERIKAQADWFIYSFWDMLDVLGMMRSMMG
eukprot:TRINITY_DN8499_c1_g1_i1.p1 TRINITY_DN8499_c1_g1~~TRINITY_DN8499_c1_g1_i1.p1  ORF type:complete len:291 (+),score=49.17 TRINITY_DN8499_c1_g1_i1:69-941(+)